MFHSEGLPQYGLMECSVSILRESIEGPRAITVREVQKRSSRGKTIIFEELKSGRLRSFKMGRSRLVLEADFRSWLASYGAPLDLSL